MLEEEAKGEELWRAGHKGLGACAWAGKVAARDARTVAGGGAALFPDQPAGSARSGTLGCEALKLLEFWPFCKYPVIMWWSPVCCS